MDNLISLLHKLSDKKFIFIFFIIGFTIYFNALFNGFVADDYILVRDNPVVHSMNLIRIFSGGSYSDAYINNYYKPVFTSVLSLIYFFSSGSPFGLHLVQIILHIVNVILVFILLRHFLKKWTSFIIALIFLVHPLNTEAVSYISSFQDVLFLLFGLTALNLMVNFKEKTYFQYMFISIFLILSILSKETGVLFLVLIPLYNYLFEKGKNIFFLFQSCIILLIYFFLRFVVAQVYLNPIKIVKIMSLPLSERIINIPKIFLFYLYTFIFPKNLTMFQDWILKRVNFNDFYFPLIVDSLFMLILLFIGFLLYKKTSIVFKTWIFFTVWFLIGMAINMQIIPLDQTVSDRWFYFPMVGLLALIGLVIQSTVPKKLSRPLFAILFVIVFLLGVRVIIRNQDWGANMCSHDIKLNKNSYQLVDCLAANFYNAGRMEDSEIYYLRSAKLYPGSTTYTSLGHFYQLRKRNKEAKKEFYAAINFKDNPAPYVDLSPILIKENPKTAIRVIEEGVNQFPKSAPLWGYLALARYKSGDYEGAMTAAIKASDISPNKEYRSIIDVIENHGVVNIR